jgi:glycosyltransferase involved in cell wall biosynthesis
MYVPVLGWVGRLQWEKGPDLFLEVLTRLRDGGVVGVLVGDGPERSAIESKVRSADLRASVILAGAQPQAAQMFRAFDALVVSSRTEGSPMVVLEAMAARVPVAAFGVGGIPHLLEGPAGWVAPPGDVAALATACRAILADGIERERRTTRAVAAVEERFGAERWLRGLDAIYDAVMLRRQQPDDGSDAA